MLIASSALRGYAIQASDGAIATVGDLLFDDVNWTVRWIVAEAGSWLSERKLLLSTQTMRSVDHDRKVFLAALSKAQFEASPPVFEHEAVSRQMESRLCTYYGSDRLWGNGVTGVGVLAPPLSMGSRFGADDSPPRDACSVIEGDPHLRSLSQLKAFHIRATDGVIGHLEASLVDDVGWHVSFIVVDTRDWWPGKRVAIPNTAVRVIDYGAREVILSLNRDRVRSSQTWDPGVSLQADHEEQRSSRDGSHGMAL